MSDSAKERVKQEHAELKEKYLKLVDFMYSEKFYTIPLNQRHLLIEQERYMKDYLFILTERLESWDKKDEENEKF